MPSRRNKSVQPVDPDWIKISGWDGRYARVIFSVVVDRFGLALVDTNGDGQELSSQTAIMETRGAWQAEEQVIDVGQSGGSGWTGHFAYAWGREHPRNAVVVEYLGVLHEVFPTSLGWWAFMHPNSDVEDEQLPRRVQSSAEEHRPR